jgi:SAM-dependent methyltransferase
MSELPFTGERFVPSERGRIAYEHYHRYATCLDAAKGKVVLDVASGEGYGAALLAGSAKKVIGVEIDPACVRHARKAYGDLANLSFVVGDCRSIPLKDKTVDLITSFETIEHVERQDEMIREFVRLLRPDGLLIVSSPDRQNYSEKTGYKNPFHVHELAHGQFVRLFQKQFRYVRVFRQRLGTASFILPDASVAPKTLQSFMIGDHGIGAGSRPLSDSVYSIVVCSQNEGASNSFSPSVHLDPDDDLFLQHEGELQAFSAERKRFVTVEQSNAAMTHALNLVTSARVDLEHRLDQANQLTARLEETRTELSKQLAAASAHAAHATNQINELAATRADLTQQIEKISLKVRQFENKAQDAEARAQQQSELTRQFELKAQDAEARAQQQSALTRSFELKAQDAEARAQQQSELTRQFELKAQDAEGRAQQQSELTRQFELKAQDAETRAQQQTELTLEVELRAEYAESTVREQSDLAREAKLRAQDAEARVQQLLNLVRQLELQAEDTESRAKQQEEALIRELEPLRANRNGAAVLRDASRQMFRQQSATIRRLTEENKVLRQRINQISRLAQYIPSAFRHPLKLLLFRSTTPD